MRIIAIAGQDKHGVYTMSNGTNGLTDVDMHAMATSGRTPMGSPVIAVFYDASALFDFCKAHGLRYGRQVAL